MSPAMPEVSLAARLVMSLVIVAMAGVIVVYHVVIERARRPRVPAPRVPAGVSEPVREPGLR